MNEISKDVAIVHIIVSEMVVKAEKFRLFLFSNRVYHANLNLYR